MNCFEYYIEKFHNIQNYNDVISTLFYILTDKERPIFTWFLTILVIYACVDYQNKSQKAKNQVKSGRQL
jgi:hypothetical protein